MKMPEGKRNVAPSWVFVLVCVLASLTLAAKERRGATVVVTMTDGNRVHGELLAVKSDALLVYDHDARLGKSLDLQQVAHVTVYKKPKFLDGLAIGLGVGLVASIYNLNKIEHESLMPLFEIVRSVLPLPVAGLSGGLLGALGSIPQKNSLAGVSPQCIQRNLTRLKRFAREADL
jgi:hypothetical protein